MTFLIAGVIAQNTDNKSRAPSQRMSAYEKRKVASGSSGGKLFGCKAVATTYNVSIIN